MFYEALASDMLVYNFYYDLLDVPYFTCSDSYSRG